MKMDTYDKSDQTVNKHSICSAYIKKEKFTS